MPSGLPGSISVNGRLCAVLNFLLCRAPAMEEQQTGREWICNVVSCYQTASGTDIMQKVCTMLIPSQAAAGLEQKHRGSENYGSP